MSTSATFVDAIEPMDALIGRTAELHRLPAAAQLLLDLTRADEYDVRAVERCLAADPALAARILRRINCARYELSRPLTSVKQGVAYLGRQSLRTMVQTFGLLDAFTPGTATDWQTIYWRRALTMATVAGRLSETNPDLDQKLAYTAALLADVGVLALVQAGGPAYPLLLDNVSHGEELIAAERRMYEFSHPALSARLLARWGFPGTIVEAAARHHADVRNAAPLERAVIAGGLVADALWAPGSPRFSAALRMLEQYFSVDRSGFLDLARWCKRDIALNASVFGVRLRDAIDLAALKAAVLPGEAVEEAAPPPAKASPRDPLDGDTGVGLSSSDTGLDLTRAYRRHLGRASVMMMRDSDPLRQTIEVEFSDVNSFTVEIRVPLEVAVHEQVRIRFENDVQRFKQELRGIVEVVQPMADGRTQIEVRLCTPLRTAEIAELKRAGIADRQLSEKIWV